LASTFDVIFLVLLVRLLLVVDLGLPVVVLLEENK